VTRFVGAEFMEDLKRIHETEILKVRQAWKNQVMQLRSKVSSLEATNQRHIRTIEAKTQRVQQSTLLLEKVQSEMSSILSPQQLDKLQRRRVIWTTEDIVKALTIRSISIKAYETLSSVWKMPLPGVSTLRRFCKNFTCSAGVLTDVVHVLTQHSKTLTPLSKLCVLLFDEMGLDGRFTYDPTFDQIVSHSKAQVLKENQASIVIDEII